MTYTNMDNIIHLLKTNRPNLSESSIKSYTSAFRSLSRKMGIDFNDEMNFVKHQKEIIDFLKDFKVHTRKTRLAGIVSILNSSEQTPSVVKAIKDYRKLMLDDVAIINKKDTDQTMTEKQKDNYISWDEVIDVYKELQKEATPLFSLKKLTPKQFYKLQDYVLLSSYVLIPPRRSQDFANLRIKGIDEKVDNYIYKKHKDNRIIFNSYKNSKRLGTQGITIPKPLWFIYRKWLKTRPNSDWFFSDEKGNHITQQKITYFLNRIFGKNISTSMLRHIYLTHKFGNINLQELQETTHEMGNSEISRSMAYIDKEMAEKEK